MQHCSVPGGCGEALEASSSSLMCPSQARHTHVMRSGSVEGTDVLKCMYMRACFPPSIGCLGPLPQQAVPPPRCLQRNSWYASVRPLLKQHLPVPWVDPEGQDSRCIAIPVWGQAPLPQPRAGTGLSSLFDCLLIKRVFNYMCRELLVEVSSTLRGRGVGVSLAVSVSPSFPPQLVPWDSKVPAPTQLGTNPCSPGYRADVILLLLWCAGPSCGALHDPFLSSWAAVPTHSLHDQP